MAGIAPKWAYAQADLFETDPAEKALTEAVENDGPNESAQWHDFAQKAIRIIAEHRSAFTTDAVWAVLARWSVSQPGKERSMGAAMRKAKVAGICEPTNIKPQPSIRPACHGRPLRVWKSCIQKHIDASTMPCPYHLCAPENEFCPYVHTESEQ